MSRFQRTWLAVGLLAPGLLAAASAHAMSGSVTVHWDTLTIDVIDTNLADGVTPTLSWSEQLTSSVALAYGPQQLLAFDEQPDWVTPGGMAHSSAGVQIATHFDAATLYVEANAQSGRQTGTRIYRDARMQVSGDARVVVSVAAEAHVALTSAEIAPGSTAYAYADANLFCSDTPDLQNTLSPVAYMSARPGTLDASATLQTAIDMHGGEAAYLFTQPGVVLSPLAVPEPASGWMLAAGLIAIASRATWRSR